jgi:SAM-dependent methyltransferase
VSKPDDIEVLLPFTAHRVRLNEDLWSTPVGGDDPFVALSTQVLIDRAGGTIKGKRILDVACLEGGFAAAFARLGAIEVVGVESRDLNIRRCLLVKRYLKLANLTFIQGDVKDVTRDWLGEFDIVFASGILYHLDDPYSFLMNISSLTRDFLLLDTHIALRDSWKHGCSKKISKRTFGGNSYLGRVATEYPPDLPRGEVEQLLWSAWSNPMSFWVTEESLVTILRDVGFKHISKVYTPRGYRCQENCPEGCRIIIIAQKDLGPLYLNVNRG